jgi:hypothetical protein
LAVAWGRANFKLRAKLVLDTVEDNHPSEDGFISIAMSGPILR